MKIVCVDNYGRETRNDYLIAENVNKTYGERIVKFLNKEEGEETPNFFKLVEDTYVLYKFEP